MASKGSSSERQKDRKRTEERIVQAALALIAREGFQGFGVNSVAREAGVDKVLIYRYFGDLAGLAARLGEDIDFWLGEASQAMIVQPTSYADFADQVLRAYIRALRHRVTLQRLLAWELVSNDEVVQRLSAARSAAVSAWFNTLARSAPPPPANIDVGATNALLIGAVHHLVLREATAGEFAGLPLRGDEAWRRVEQAVHHIVIRALS